MRPADVCGWKRNPLASNSLIVFRIVAGDTPSPNRRDSVRDPAGSAVSTYMRMTASRTRRSRLESSSDAISSNILTTSEVCQVRGDRVQSKPAECCEHQPTVVANMSPTLVDPCAGRRQLRTCELEARARAEAEVHRFCAAV